MTKIGDWIAFVFLIILMVLGMIFSHEFLEPKLGGKWVKVIVAFLGVITVTAWGRVEAGFKRDLLKEIEELKEKLHAE